MAQNSADIDHLLKLETGELSVTATLRVQAMAPPELISRDSLKGYLLGRDINQQSIVMDELDQLIADVAADNTQPHERQVMQGTPTEHGSNARIELTPEFDERFKQIQKRKEAFLIAQEENAFDGEEDNAIDFYNESSFVTANEGDHIANFIPHTQGRDGIDVYSKTIAAKPGKPINKPCDESCRLDSQNKIIAMQDGLIYLTHERISVQSTLNIPGFVDFSTGNVNFPGDIVIEKGVRDRFKVQSDFNIEVHKLVEAAHLHAESNIKLHQGMAGRESGTIETDGDLDSGYLDAVEADIMGNCLIEREITNCTIRVSGRIEAKNATIRGGQIEVGRGGIVGTLGSEGGVRTEIILASHPVIQSKVGQIKDLLPKLTAELDKSNREAKVLRNSMGKGNQELETEVWFLESNVEALKEKQGELEDALQRLYALLSKHTECVLTVTGRIFAKTVIWLPGKQATFDRDLKGEFTIKLDSTGRAVVDYGDRTEPLESVAKVHSDDRVPAPVKDQSEAA